MQLGISMWLAVWFCESVCIKCKCYALLIWQALIFPSPWWSSWWRRYFSNLNTWIGAQTVVAMRSVVPLIFLSGLFMSFFQSPLIFTLSSSLLIKRGEREQRLVLQVCPAVWSNCEKVLLCLPKRNMIHNERIFFGRVFHCLKITHVN